MAALAAALLLLAAGARRVVPRLPLQFVATATAESHLVDKVRGGVRAAAKRLARRATQPCSPGA